MAVNLPVPYYSNTPDDTHCYQAALRMVLGYFQPGIEYSWEELDQITAKEPNKWTWPMAGLSWLTEHGYEVRNIEDFDYVSFIRDGKEYLVRKFGADVAEAQVEHSTLPLEQARSKHFMECVTTEPRLPDINDVYELLESGFILIANVNSRSLNDRPGFVGHFIVIKGYDEGGLFIHDPGLPGIENRHVSLKQFLQGWDYPDEEARNLMAIRAL